MTNIKDDNRKLIIKARICKINFNQRIPNKCIDSPGSIEIPKGDVFVLGDHPKNMTLVQFLWKT